MTMRMNWMEAKYGFEQIQNCWICKASNMFLSAEYEV